jgi:lipoic acid synthetase
MNESVVAGPQRGRAKTARHVAPQHFNAIAAQARAMGFVHAAWGPLVRSCYHADQQALAAGV